MAVHLMACPSLLPYIVQAKYYSSKDEKPKARYPSKTISSLTSLRLFVRQKSVPLVGEMTTALEKV